MVVLICLIFSVLSTIKEYHQFANETLFYMVRKRMFTFAGTNQRNFSKSLFTRFSS